MKTIIAGSRSIKDYNILEKAVKESGFDITVVFSGGARGVDKLGEMWAARHGVQIKFFSARWDMYGKSAGVKRNAVMAEQADALIAVWDGVSKGTAIMIRIAKSKGLKIFVKKVRP